MASDQLDDLYINSLLCGTCYKEVKHSQPRSCSHVICENCDAEFRKTNPGQDCQLCIESRRTTTRSADQSYLVRVKPSVPLRRRQRSSSSCGSPSCASCRKKVQMTAYCEDCKGDICRNCCEQHANLSALRNHKLELKTPVQDSRISTTYCHKHSEKYASIVCRTCNAERVCQKCVKEAHIGHDIEHSTGSSSQRRSATLPSDLSSLPQETYGDLVKYLEDLQINVQERSQTLTFSMREAENEIQIHAGNWIQEKVENAEKAKREIDRQVTEYIEKITNQKENLMNRIQRRQNFIQQRSQMIDFELKEVLGDSQKVLKTFNRCSLDDDGYTQMAQCQELFTKRQQLKEKIESLQKSFNDLTFDYLVSTEERCSLGKITTLRKWSRITDSCIQRIKQDTDYVPSAMMSAPNGTILFSSYKGATKAALDLVNINGNAIYTRKLQDNGQDVIPTPVFGAMIESDVAMIGWETTVFTLKLSSHDPVSSIGIKNLFVPTARIHCLVADQNLHQVAVGNDKNRIINIFDFDMKPTSSITIKEEGPPPSSLAFQGKNILFTDGERTALAVDRNGNTVAQFLPPGTSNLKPVAIDASRGLVYVLWVNDSSAVVQCYTMKDPAMLGNPVGEPLSELPGDTKFIAVIPTVDGDDRLVTGTSDARIVVYCIQEI